MAPVRRGATAAAPPPPPAAAGPASSESDASSQPASPRAPRHAVSAEVTLRPRGSLSGRASKPGAARWSLLGLLREGVRQVLPEPVPVRPYVHPSQYTVKDSKVYWADGMSEDYEPNLFTKVFAALTLGLYIGVPNIILTLLVASFWSAWARAGLALIVATHFLPLRPLLWRRVMNSYVFLTWRRYFKFSYVFDQTLDAWNDYVIAQFPHGAYPLGGFVCGTFMATQYPEYTCYALAASNSFLVPIWRHVHTWVGCMAATETNFRRLLALGTGRGLRAAAARAAGRAPAPEDDGRGSGSGGGSSAGASEAGEEAPAGGAGGGAASAAVAVGADAKRVSRLRKRNPQGVSIGVMVGGIAEMYLQHPDYEQIKLLDRKGFVRVAIEHGADILPVYMFGASRMMSFGPPWLMDAARRMRASIGVLYGAWGTPIPRRAQLRMAVGVPVPVGPATQRGEPGFDARVEEVHAAVVEAIRTVYHRHRGEYGWGDRELVIV